MDVTDPAAVKAAATRIVDAMGRIDILACTVAVPAFGPFLEIGPDTFRAAQALRNSGVPSAAPR